MKSVLLLLVSAVAMNSWSRDHAVRNWEPVSAYLASHSLNFSPDIDARLCEEALSGEKTWDLCGANVSASRVADPGIGWPSESEVLRFATSAERNNAANLILDITYQRRPAN